MKDVYLWTFNWESETPDASLSSLLPPLEYQHWQSISHPRRKSEYLFGHALARVHLADFFKLPPQDIPLEMTSREAPRIITENLPEPYNKQSWFFSLAHSGTEIIWALSNNPIGIDVEVFRPRNPLLDLAKNTFSAAEVAELAALPEQDQQQRFHHIWSLKEALFKAGQIPLGGVLFKTKFNFDLNGALLDASFLESTNNIWQFKSWKNENMYYALAVQTGEELEVKTI